MSAIATTFEQNSMKIPDNLRYSSEHLWVRADDDGSLLAGITDYAQDLLGDIVFVDAPKVGTQLQAGSPCGLVESVKTGSDLHAPLDGTVIAINTALQDHPERINDAPYESWIFRFEADPSAMQGLLDAAAYRDLVGG
jgi:glycine cleavage system H protein